MDILSYAKSIPVRYETDVLVAGGGPAGVAAAVVAARNGARVFLVEAGTCLGGSGTAAGIAMFCSPTDGVHETSAGFGSELYDRLIDVGAAAPGITRENKYTRLISYKVEDAKRVYDGILSESGARFLFTARLVDVVREGNRIATAVCAAKSGLFAVRAKVFVDATGDGDLCAFAGPSANSEIPTAPSRPQPSPACGRASTGNAPRRQAAAHGRTSVASARRSRTASSRSTTGICRGSSPSRGTPQWATWAMCSALTAAARNR